MEKQKKQATQEKQTYGTRKCLNCKATFEADAPWRITCSEKCARERRRALNRKSDARRKSRRKAYLLELLADINMAEKELEWLNNQHENLLCTVPMNGAEAKFEAGIYYQLKNAEIHNEGLKAELDKMKEAANQSIGLKDNLAKEQERNAELLEEMARLKEEISRTVKENGHTVRELQEKLAYAEKQLEELQAPAAGQPEKPEETEPEPAKPTLKTPVRKDGGYDLRCQECGQMFWSRDKDEKFCCSDCFLADKKRKDIEAANANGYPAKKAKKNR